MCTLFIRGGVIQNTKVNFLVQNYDGTYYSFLVLFKAKNILYFSGFRTRIV